MIIIKSFQRLKGATKRENYKFNKMGKVIIFKLKIYKGKAQYNIILLKSSIFWMTLHFMMKILVLMRSLLITYFILLPKFKSKIKIFLKNIKKIKLIKFVIQINQFINKTIYNLRKIH